jgi:hypothetical protein
MSVTGKKDASLWSNKPGDKNERVDEGARQLSAGTRRDVTAIAPQSHLVRLYICRYCMYILHLHDSGGWDEGYWEVGRGHKMVEAFFHGYEPMRMCKRKREAD